MKQRLNDLFKRSKKLFIDDNTKLVIMSDCHRGSGNHYDNFVKNQNIFEAALRYYYMNDFIYIELGDGDDMWEVSNYKDIIDEYLNTFKLLKKFHDANRLIMIYGNHDIEKKSKAILKKYFYQYENKETGETEKLLNGLVIEESLVLDYKNHEIFMIHGHQVSFFNSTLWRFSRFLVRNVWSHLENIGIKDPTSAAKNYRVKRKTEKRLKKWSIKNNKILIAGHTHRPIFPQIGNSLYFNDGSCIHPDGITCLEVEKGNIALVKWSFQLSKGNLISVGREVLEGKEPIHHFFQ